MAKPASTKPELTSEQKVTRALAVVGSIITFIGASFGVVLAIQTGLLGPFGRAIGAMIFALILLGVGIFAEQRRGPSPGVTALYVTSLLVLLLDLAYATHSELWIDPLLMLVLFLLAWIGYVGLAVWRRNLWLLICMCVVLFFYQFQLDSNGLALIAPLAVLAATVLPEMLREPRFATASRIGAGILLVWQCVIIGFNGTLIAFGEPAETLEPTVFMALASVFVLVAVELFFHVPHEDVQSPQPPSLTPQPQQGAAGAVGAGGVSGTPDTRGLAALVTAVVLPALLLFGSNIFVGEWALLMQPATAALVILFILFAAPKQRLEQATTFLTGWLIVAPFTFIYISQMTFDHDPRIAEQEMVPPLIYTVAFIAVVVIMRLRPVHRIAVLSAWLLGLLFQTAHLLGLTLGSNLLTPLTVFDLLQGLALAILVGFLVSQRWLWRSMIPRARGVFVGIGLVAATVATVTKTSSIGELISPSPKRYSSERTTGPRDLYGWEVGFTIGHMIVSIALMALAAWLWLRRSNKITPKASSTAGLILAVTATLKLVLFDMASISGIPRVITFTVCGLLLIAVAVIGNTNSKRDGIANAQPTAPHGGPVSPTGADGTVAPAPAMAGPQQPVETQPAAPPAPQAPPAAGPNQEEYPPRTDQ